MKKNSGSFSMDEVMRLANSEAGKKLISILQSQNSEQLKKAAAEAANGDYETASKTMSGALDSQQIQALLAQLRGQSHG